MPEKTEKTPAPRTNKVVVKTPATSSQYGGDKAGAKKNKPVRTKESTKKQAMLNTHKINPFKYDMNEILSASSMDPSKASSFLASIIAKASRVSTRDAKDFAKTFVESGDLSKDEYDRICRLLDKYSKYRRGRSMASEEVLKGTLRNADGKPFAKYKNLQNSFVLEDFELFFDDVQNDRAGHTAMRVRVPMKRAMFPEDTYNTKTREIALRDLIARRFWEACRTYARSPIPKTDGGEMFIPRPGQEILERWSVVITPYYVEARFTADLPSAGGKVSAAAMEELIYVRIKCVVGESMIYPSYKQSKLYNHIHTAENAEFIRSHLKERGLVAFVADGSILPRREDELAPMSDAVPFSCDDSLRVTFEVPNGDPITGWGVKRHMNVVLGAPRSGRSTLTDAIAAGPYNHIPGDGREYVVSFPCASFVISEPGRPADSVDVSMFMRDSPEFGEASAAKAESLCGCHSEYVSMSEYVELTSKLLIVDEEYVSPETLRRGFMDDSGKMVPLTEAGPALASATVATFIVSGDPEVAKSADTVVVMDGFGVRKADVQKVEREFSFKVPRDRYPVSKGINYEKGRKEVSVTASSVRSIEIGSYQVNAPVAAVYDMSQARTIADIIAVAKELMDGSRTLLQVVTEAIEIVKAQDNAKDSATGMWHSQVRDLDVAAFLNRHPQMLCIQRKRFACGYCRSCPASG